MYTSNMVSYLVENRLCVLFIRLRIKISYIQSRALDHLPNDKTENTHFSRKSSQIVVTIDALLQCVGPLSEEGIYEELKKEFQLQESVQTSAISVALSIALLLLFLVSLIAGILFCYFRRLLCFKNRSKKMTATTIDATTLPPIHTIIPAEEKKPNLRRAPLPPINTKGVKPAPPVPPNKPDLKMFLSNDDIMPGLHVPMPEPPPSYEEAGNSARV